MAGAAAGEILVAGSGAVYVAPLGTAMPADESAALNAAFKDLGYVSEGGVTPTVGRTKQGLKAWQSFYDLRRIITDTSMQLAFTLMQWNKDTLAFAFGGGTVSDVSTGHHKYAPPDPLDGPDTRAFVLEFSDGTSRKYRLIAPRVEIEGDVAPALTRTDFAGFPVTVSILATGSGDPWDLLCNDAVFA